VQVDAQVLLEVGGDLGEVGLGDYGSEVEVLSDPLNDGVANVLGLKSLDAIGVFFLSFYFGLHERV